MPRPKLSDALSNPSLYHYLRQILTGGMPFKEWTMLYGLDDASQRVADIGCGPADILRYLTPATRPAFYLGIDISDRYLNSARKKAAKRGVDAEFRRMDLDRLPDDSDLQQELIDTLSVHRITRVLLMGVLHHIGDRAAKTTLDLAHRVPSVQRLMTMDVVYIPRQTLNNLLCDFDRGEFVRTEAEYDELARLASWEGYDKHMTSPRMEFIRYIHYSFYRNGVDTSMKPRP